MLVKIALAVLIGALAGMVVGTRGVLWPAAPGPQALDGARTLAHVEGAWHALRQHRSP
jgi:hypothetical protein